MQGDCAAPFQGGSDGPPVGDLAPRQCVLSLTARLVQLIDHAPGLWLDNLALRFMSTSGVFGLVRSVLSAEASTGAGAIWLTGVAVAGGGLAAGVRVGGATLFASSALPSCACTACGRRAVSDPSSSAERQQCEMRYGPLHRSRACTARCRRPHLRRGVMRVDLCSKCVPRAGCRSYNEGI